MNILVTGANGQLGSEMRIVAKGSRDSFVFTDVIDIPGVETVKLDITRIGEIRDLVKKKRIKAIVNCAAFTNVDAAEDNYEFAELLNSEAVENLAVVMKEVGGLLVHISTDYVFGGEVYNTPCKEGQKCTPTGVYGLTKMHGEHAIERVGCEHIIIRTAWLYSEFGRNFVKTMMNLTSTRPQVKVVFDQVGTPTYALDLAKVIISILSRRQYSGKTGIYHFSNEGVCSWFDFTKRITEYAGCTECEILPCHSNEFPSKVKRPAFSVLDKTKIKESFGVTIPYWADSLKECINNLVRMK